MIDQDNRRYGSETTARSRCTNHCSCLQSRDGNKRYLVAKVTCLSKKNGLPTQPHKLSKVQTDNPESSDIGLSHLLDISSTVPLPTIHLSPRRASLTISPSSPISPPFPLPDPFLFLRSRTLPLFVLLPPLPPLSLLPRPLLTIQAFRLPSCSLLIFLTDQPRLSQYLLSKRGILGPRGGFFVCSADNGCANKIQFQPLSAGLRGPVRPTNPLQQHLPHLPKRPHAPFHLDHSPDIHPAQIDIATRSRHALTTSFPSAQARRTLR